MKGSFQLIDIEEKKDSYKVQLPVFEGPFDALLHLIEEQKVDIYEVSISTITAGYLEYIRQIQTMDLELSSEFMIMAAILIEMKSKMLLPKDNQNNDDLLAEAEAEKMALLDRLVEYKTFKTMAQKLAEREAENLFVHTRDDINNELINALPLERIIHLKNVDMNLLLRAFNRVWQEFELRIMTREVQHMSQTYFSVKNKMQLIVERLIHTQTTVTFSSLFSEATQRTEIIATFIGVLELVRQQFILIMQNDTFDEIEIIARKNIADKEIEYGEEDAPQGEISNEHSTGA